MFNESGIVIQSVFEKYDSLAVSDLFKCCVRKILSNTFSRNDLNDFGNMYIYNTVNRKDNRFAFKNLYELGKKNDFIKKIIEESNVDYELISHKNKGGANIDVDLQTVELYFYFLREGKCKIIPNLYNYLEKEYGFYGNKKQINILIQLLLIYKEEEIVSKLLDVIPKVMMNDASLSGVKIKEFLNYVEKNNLSSTNKNKFDLLFNNKDDLFDESINTVSITLNPEKISNFTSKNQNLSGPNIIIKLNEELDKEKNKTGIFKGFVSNRKKVTRYEFITKEKNDIVLADLINRFEFKYEDGRKEETLKLLKDFFNSVIKNKNLNSQNFDEVVSESIKAFAIKESLNSCLKSSNNKKIKI